MKLQEAITLPNGTVLRLLRKAKVRDLLQARRVIKALTGVKSDDEMDELEVSLAVTAQVMEFDGRPAVYEDLLELDLDDLDPLMKAAGANFQA